MIKHRVTVCDTECVIQDHSQIDERYIRYARIEDDRQFDLVWIPSGRRRSVRLVFEVRSVYLKRENMSAAVELLVLSRL